MRINMSNKSKNAIWKMAIVSVVLIVVLLSGTMPTFAAGSASTTANAVTLAPLNLGTAGNFVILSKSGITDVPTSVITGNVGTSPITGAANHLTCKEVTGIIYSVDAAGPAPCSVKSPAKLTAAVSDMQTAYTNAFATDTK